MTWPTTTLTRANALFACVGVEIKEHPLGFYQAKVGNATHSNRKLSDLTDELMKTYFKIPESNGKKISMAQDVDPDYDEWQYLSERRHVEAGFL